MEEREALHRNILQVKVCGRSTETEAVAESNAVFTRLPAGIWTHGEAAEQIHRFDIRLITDAVHKRLRDLAVSVIEAVEHVIGLLRLEIVQL